MLFTFSSAVVFLSYAIVLAGWLQAPMLLLLLCVVVVDGSFVAECLKTGSAGGVGTRFFNTFLK